MPAVRMSLEAVFEMQGFDLSCAWEILHNLDTALTMLAHEQHFWGFLLASQLSPNVKSTQCDHYLPLDVGDGFPDIITLEFSGNLCEEHLLKI